MKRKANRTIEIILINPRALVGELSRKEALVQLDVARGGDAGKGFIPQVEAQIGLDPAICNGIAKFYGAGLRYNQTNAGIVAFKLADFVSGFDGLLSILLRVRILVDILGYGCVECLYYRSGAVVILMMCAMRLQA